MTTPVDADFIVDLVEGARVLLANAGLRVPTGMKPRAVLHALVNAETRHIEPRRRNVHRSRELTERSLPLDQAEALDRIQGVFESGGNIKPYQSTLIENASYQDAALTDWAVQHLHLGLATGRVARRPGFVRRGEELLFVHVTQDDVYFLDVTGHDFLDDSMLDIIHGNWRQLIAPYRLHTVPAPPRRCDLRRKAELRRARKAGVQMLMTTVDGAVYAPIGGGITTARTNATGTARVDRLLEWASGQEQAVREMADHIAESVSAALGRPVAFLTLKLCFEGEPWNVRFYLRELRFHEDLGERYHLEF